MAKRDDSWDRMARLFQRDGLSFATIAARYGLTSEAVAYRVRQVLGREAVAQELAARGQRIPPAVKAKAIARLLAGERTQAIARELGVHQQTAQRWRNAHRQSADS